MTPLYNFTYESSKNISRNNIQDLFTLWRIKANASNSVHITFTNRKENEFPVLFNEQQLKPVIRLGERLTWQKHIFAKRKQLCLQYNKLQWLIERNNKLTLESINCYYTTAHHTTVYHTTVYHMYCILKNFTVFRIKFYLRQLTSLVRYECFLVPPHVVTSCTSWMSGQECYCDFLNLLYCGCRFYFW